MPAQTPSPSPGEAPTGVPAERAPIVLGRYRLLRRLGAGGFGTVWVAHDERLGREVAVKAIPRSRVGEDAAAEARAHREAVAAARLSHPAVVTLYEAGADDEAHYLISEVVAGRTLAELIATRAMSDRDVAMIGLALAGALAHAHERGVVHRDVKPGNVIVPDRPQGPLGVAKLTDFGIAHLAGEEALTRTGDVVGTLAYMAPEQAEGRAAGPEADLYALALVLYECLSGTHPVRRAGPAATARRLGAVLPSLGRVRRDLPAGLVGAIDRGVAPRPRDRGTLTELRAALADSVALLSREGGTLALPVRQLRLPRGSGRVGAGLAAAGLVAAVPLLGANPLPVPSGAVAAAVGVAVVVLPRVAWLVAAALAVGWLALPGLGERPGAALVLAVAALGGPALAPRSGRLWSLPALAPLLGLAAGAVLFAGVAGQLRRVGARAALGALGAWWVTLAEPLLGRSLHLAGPTTPRDPAAWTASASDGLRDGVLAILHPGTAVLVASWAMAAACLPWLVRGRSLAADGLGAAAWAVGLGLAGLAAAALAHPDWAAPAPRGGLLAPLVAGLAVVAVARLRASWAPLPGAAPEGNGD